LAYSAQPPQIKLHRIDTNKAAGGVYSPWNARFSQTNTLNPTEAIVMAVPAGRCESASLWHSIDRRFISRVAAGWHISFDVLDHLLRGTPIGRIAGGEAMNLGG